jgi:tetratricopeptide (TPR) repeat protein
VNRERGRETEYEEILGYHLEQAYRYLSELGPIDEHGRELGRDGSRRLASAGRRAVARGDVPAASSLLGRAVALLPEDDPGRLELLPHYGEALIHFGRFEDAEQVLEEAIERGDAAGLPAVMSWAELVRILLRLRTAGRESGTEDEARATIEQAKVVLREQGDDAGLALAWRSLSWIDATACRFADAAEASLHALEHARRAGDVRQQSRAATLYAGVSYFGPTPVSEAISRCESIVTEVTGDRQSESTVLSVLANLLAMQGSFDDARRRVLEARGMLEELGLEIDLAGVALEAWRVEMFAGDTEAAEGELRAAFDTLVRLGEKYLLCSVAGLLGQTLYALGRFDEVEPFARMARELATEDDVDTQALWRCLEAKMLARRGAFDEAEILVREALDMLSPTDAVLFKYGALLDLAEVRRLAGHDVDAILADARTLADTKGSPVMAAAVEALFAAAA